MLIYIIENLINGYVYVGQTTLTLERRKTGHLHNAKNPNRKGNSYLCSAINKYGSENFQFSVIEDNIEIQEDLDKAEIYWIRWYDSTNRTIGYNLESGGNGIGRLSNETKTKLSIINKIRTSDPLVRQRMSEARLGTKVNEETKKKMSNARLGRIYSDEYRNNMSIAKKLEYSLKTKHPSLGMKRTQESIAKMKSHLNYELAELIRKQYSEGKTVKELCIDYNVTTNSIYNIVFNRTFKSPDKKQSQKYE